MDRETSDKTHTSGSGDPDTEKERNFRESAQTGTGPYGNRGRIRIFGIGRRSPERRGRRSSERICGRPR